MATAKEKMDIIVSTKGTQTTKKKLGGVEKSIKSMAIGAVSATAIFYSLKKAMAAVIKVGSTFEQTMSNVKAISGATNKEFKALTENAKKLGASTKFTASEVGGLQVEYSKLGFSASEIVKVTKGTLDLASATGETLAASATVAGATLRGFGLDASETGRVTDVMALSFSSSGLDLEKFRESMKTIAPISKAANFSIEETTALLGKLADGGLSGSIAAMGLKNILSKLTDPTSKLNELFGGQVQTYDQLIPALQKLKKENFNLADASKYLDERAKATFLTLVNASDDVDTLKKSLDNATGSAKKMAEIQMDNLIGDTDKLKSAMEGLGIIIYDEIGPGLRSTTKELNNFVDSLSLLTEHPAVETLVAIGKVLAYWQLAQAAVGLDVLKKALDDGKTATYEYTEAGQKLHDQWLKNNEQSIKQWEQTYLGIGADKEKITVTDTIIGQNNKLIEQQMQMMGIGEIRTPLEISPLIEYNEQFQSKTDESYKFFLQKYNKMEQIGNRFAGAMSGAIMQMAGSNKQSFQVIADAFKNMLTQMAAEMAAKAAIFGILNIATGGAFGLFQKGKGGGSGLMNFLFAQHGANFITDKPTLILAGEGGRAEHVKITPAPINNNSVSTVNYINAVMDAEAFKMMLRSGGNEVIIGEIESDRL